MTDICESLDSSLRWNDIVRGIQTASLVCILLAFLALCVTGCSLNKINTQQESLAPGKESPGVVEEATITQTASEHALVSDNIRCIYAGTDSVWVGTDRGISVYHKKDSRWTEFHREDGLISDDVTSIAIDGKSVWVGTRFGASFYDVDKNTWTSFQKRDGLADNRISSIAVDSNYVWFGTESGISRYDKTLGAWSLKKEKGKEEPNKIRAIAVEAEYVWFGTQEGLKRYEKAKDSWNTYTENEGLIQNHVSCIALSKDAVWVGTEKSGMSKYSRSNQTFTKSYNKNDPLESNFIKAIAVDASSIWFGSADNGLRRYITTVDTWSRYTTAQGLVSDHITCLAVDGNDMWIGTYEHGLCRYNKVNNTWTSYSERDALASNHIKSLASADEMVWIGTTEGLSCYDSGRKTWTTYTKASGLATDYITYVTVDEKTGTIWVGTPLGLGKFIFDIQPGNPSQPASESSIQYPASSIQNPASSIQYPASRRWRFYTVAQGLADNFVNCVSVSGDDVWVATRGGLNLLRTDKLHTYLEGEWVTAVIAVGADVWAGTSHGLYRKNSEQDQFDRFPSVECYVNTLAIGQNGQLLAGSREGLWIVDTRATGPEPPPGHILPGSNVRAIAADDDYIWIGTPQGIAQHSATQDPRRKTQDARPKTQDPRPKTQDSRLVTRYSLLSCVLSLESLNIEYPVSSISIAGDRVFLGTAAGLVIYDRKADQWETHKAYYQTQILREDNINWMELDGRYLWAINWSASQNGAILRFDTDTDIRIKYTKEEIPLSSEVPFITEVSRITVDADSVWFATNGGVLRYNKESDTWTHFTRSSGLPGHRALFVEIDPPNYVWVVFHGGVASYYDKRTGEWDTLQVTGAGVGTNIEAVAFTEKYVWFSTEYTGIRRYERATGDWTSYSEADGMASREGPWILADGQDVWTAGWGTYSWVSGMGSGGVSKYDASSGKWAIYDRTRGLLATNGLQCGQVSDNYLWCFGYDGINRYDKEAATWVSFTQDDGIPDFRVTAVAEDGRSLWIGTGSKGVARYHEASGAWTSFSSEDGLADNSIKDYALKVDSKYVWAGTSKGLSRYDKERRTWTSFTRPANLASRRALAVAVEPRYVWVGTHCGLSRYDKRHGTWKHFQKEEEQRRFPWEMPRPQEKKKKENELVDNNVVGLSLDERYVWIATEAGVGRYDKVADRFESYTKENQIPSDDVRAIGENRSHVWIGTKNGISKHNILSDDKNAWETYNTAIEVQPMLMKEEYARSLDNDDVRCLAVEENRVWVGTKTGVSLYDLRKGTWRTFRQKDGLAGDEVSCIAVDGENVWFGSGRGVSMYNTRSGSWQVFTERDGLASDLITSIAVSERCICFGTFDKGITILDKAGNEFTTYTKKHGLPHNGILSIAIDGDLIWVGTHGGLTRYDTITQTWTIYTEGFDWDGV